MTLLRPLVSLFVFALAVLWSGSALADVRCVQEVLSKTVFDPGPVDGLWGKNTANAARDFLIYRDGELSVEVAKSNSDALCQTVSNEGRDYEPLTLRRYAIIIAPEKMEDLAERGVFSFEGLDIDEQLNMKNCSFELSRKWDDIGKIEGMGSGKLDIVNGLIEFGRHHWTVGPHANDDKFLKEQTKLGVLKNGNLVGKLIYFHLFHQPGGSYDPPRTVLFDGSNAVIQKGLRSTHSFTFGDPGFSGLLSFRCKPEPTSANLEKWPQIFKDVLTACSRADLSTLEDLNDESCATALMIGIQTELIRHKCRPGVVDGVYGNGTVNALERLSKSEKVELLKCSLPDFGDEVCSGFESLLMNPLGMSAYQGQWSSEQGELLRALYKSLRSGWNYCQHTH